MKWVLNAHGLLRDDGDHDGVVRVEERRLPAMAEHHEVHANHATMPFDREVRARTIAFLRACATAQQ